MSGSATRPPVGLKRHGLVLLRGGRPSQERDDERAEAEWLAGNAAIGWQEPVGPEPDLDGLCARIARGVGAELEHAEPEIAEGEAPGGEDWRPPARDLRRRPLRFGLGALAVAAACGAAAALALAWLAQREPTRLDRDVADRVGAPPALPSAQPEEAPRTEPSATPRALERPRLPSPRVRPPGARELATRTPEAPPRARVGASRRAEPIAEGGAERRDRGTPWLAALGDSVAALAPAPNSGAIATPVADVAPGPRRAELDLDAEAFDAAPATRSADLGLASVDPKMDALSLAPSRRRALGVGLPPEPAEGAPDRGAPGLMAQLDLSRALDVF